MAGAENVRQKPVQVMLDKPRTLLYNFNAFVRLEELYGNIDKAMSGFGGMQLRAIRDLLWAGLLHEDKELTPDQVGDVIQLSELETLVENIGEAIERAMPGKEASPGK